MEGIPEPTNNVSDDHYFDSEEFQEILNEYEDALDKGLPVFLDTDDLADIADYYQINNRYEDAKAAIDIALEKEPGATLPLVFKVREALIDQDITLAKNFLKLIENKDDIEYLYVSAEVLIAQNKIEEADQLFRKELRKTQPDEYQDYVVDVASIFSDYGVHDKAMQWMMRAKRENTDDFKELMARTLFGVGKYEESERLFNELIDHNPFSKTYWNALASVQFMNEDYCASITSSEYAIAIDPKDPDGLLAKANGLFRLDNYEESLKYYQRYCQEVPDDEFGLLHQGTCLVNLGRYKEAAEKLEAAIETAHPDSPYLGEIYQELGFTYSEMKMPDTAIYYLDQADLYEGDHVDLLVIKGHVMLANERVKEAEQLFKQAINLSDNTAKTLLRVIVSLYDNKYVKACYQMFKKYFKIVGRNNDEGYSYMALCCWDMKLYDEFLQYLQIAVKRNPHEARIVLGMLFPEGMNSEDYYQYMQDSLKK